MGKSAPWTLERLARHSGRPLELLAGWLELPPLERPFFSGATQKQGEWLIPAGEVRDFLQMRVEQLFTARQAATLLKLSYPEVTRRIVTTRKPLGREIGGLFLGSRLRVPESEIIRLSTPAWKK